MVIGMLTFCALLYSMCNLKAIQMNMQCSLIWELTVYEFEQGYKGRETTKNICCAKGEGTVDHNQTGLGRIKTIDSKARLLAMEANSGSIPVQHSLSPSRAQQKHLELPNGVSHTTKILQNL